MKKPSSHNTTQPPLDSYFLRNSQPSEAVLQIAAGKNVTPIVPGDGICLYHFITSTCSQRVRLAAAEKRVPYRSALFDLMTFDNLTPEYLSINPRGVVPSWVDGDMAVFDSPTIIRYIDARYKGPSLRPSDSAARQIVEAWIDAGDAFPNRYLTYYQQYELADHDLAGVDIKPWVDELKKRCAEAKTAHPDLAALYQSKIDDFNAFFSELTDTAFMAQCLEFAAAGLDELDARVAESPFICGSKYTLADTCWTTSLIRLESYHRYGRREWFSSSLRPHLASYVERLKRRPSFAAAYVAYFRQLPTLLTGAEPLLLKQRFHELAHFYDDYAQH